jgi:hypothetical protein
MAIEFEKLNPASFNKKFYEKMEEINYVRYIDEKNYKVPEFIDDKNLK